MATFEGLRQGLGDMDRRDGVVALAQVDVAGDIRTFNGSVFNIIKAEFAAGGCNNDTVLGFGFSLPVSLSKKLTNLYHLNSFFITLYSI